MAKSKTTIFERTWVKACILLVVFIAAYWIPLKTMVNTWWSNEDYSYGFLIPMISAYFLWDQRQRFKAIPVKSSWKALPGLILFVILSIYGILGSSGSVSMPSVPILIMLFVLFCFGWEALKRFFLPLAFLVFMVPLPAVVERYIGLYLKSVSTRLGGMIIGLFNIPVYVS